MMTDDFDRRLSDRINEVFDNFEDTSADAGWALLREKYPEKEKRRSIIWLWMGSAAAILLILLGLWIWGGKQRVDSNKQVVKAPRSEKRNIDSLVKSSHANRVAKVNAEDSAMVTTHTPVISNSPVKSTVVIPNTIRADKLLRQSNVANGSQQPTTSPQNSVTVNEPAKVVQQQADEHEAIGTKTAANTKSLVDSSAAKAVAQNEVKPAKSVVKSPFTDNDPVIKKDRSANTDKSDKQVSFGVYAATYLNYASGSNSQVNVGAGLASDIHIAKNLKLSTGVAVNQNSFSYGNRLPQQNGALFAAATQVSVVPANYNLGSGSSSGASYAIPVLKSYNAQLTSLDVPLNIKYEFNPERNSSFISLGVSSGTFITENYSSEYTSTASSQSLNSNIGGFSSFYFAKTLDFSFGLGYPIGKNHLSIEPFVKYPLQGLGADDIRFGAGGLNLKFNFSNSKK